MPNQLRRGGLRAFSYGGIEQGLRRAGWPVEAITGEPIEPAGAA